MDEIEAIGFVFSNRVAVNGWNDGSSTGTSSCGGGCAVLGFVEDGLGGDDGGGFDFRDGVGGQADVHAVAWVSGVVCFAENTTHTHHESGGVLVFVLASSGGEERKFGDACPVVLPRHCACCETGVCHDWAF